MVTEPCFETAFGRFVLSRHGRTDAPDEQNLRAWNAADELLLAHLASGQLDARARILLLNDAFGALTTALSGFRLSVAGDSLVAQRAIRNNLEANHIDASSIRFLGSLDAPEPELLDLLLIRIPKSLALLEDQLCRYRGLCAGSTRIIATGMVKHLPAGAFRVFERCLGPVTTSLAQRKARLLFCQPDPACAAVTSRYPVSYRLDAADCLIEDHANVFSVGALDLGTRFFLPWIPAHDEPLRIADLGCGNGILGLCAAQRCPGATVDFFDESFMALASAEGNFSRACPGREARFIAADGLAGVPDQSYDLILCNPPFHQQHVVGDFIARQLFMDAHRALKSGGELRVVGNRHLGYAQMLRRLFGSADVLAVNPKFVVIRALRR